MAINEMLVHEDGIQKQWAMYHVSKSSLDAKTRSSFLWKDSYMSHPTQITHHLSLYRSKELPEWSKGICTSSLLDKSPGSCVEYSKEFL